MFDNENAHNIPKQLFNVIHRYFNMIFYITSSLRELINVKSDIAAMLQDCGVHAILTSVRFKPNECIL